MTLNIHVRERSNNQKSFWIDPHLGAYGRKVYSQNDEDGVLEYLCRILRIEKGYFVEIGVGPPFGGKAEVDGLEANCRLLRERGWDGLWMDGTTYPAINCVKEEFVTPLNVNLLLSKYSCPSEIDVFSIDVDGQDFWIWMNLLVRPKIVVIEYNSGFEPDESKVILFDVAFRWDCTSYQGASLAAMCKLGRSRFYTPVYANGVNTFFVRDDMISNSADFPHVLRQPRSPLHRPDPPNRPWTVI